MLSRVAFLGAAFVCAVQPKNEKNGAFLQAGTLETPQAEGFPFFPCWRTLLRSRIFRILATFLDCSRFFFYAHCFSPSFSSISNVASGSPFQMEPNQGEEQTEPHPFLHVVLFGNLCNHRRKHLFRKNIEGLSFPPKAREPQNICLKV